MIKRLLTAVVICPLAVAAMLVSWDEPFTVFILIAIMMSLHDVKGISRHLKAPVYNVLLNLLAVGYIVILHVQLKYMPFQSYIETFVLPGIMLVIALRAVASGGRDDPFRRAAMTVFMFFYVVYLSGYAIQLRFLSNDGPKYVFYLFLLTWAGDAGAYFIGRKFGVHKMTAISPNKSWEGLVGGFAAGLAGANLLHYLFPIDGFGYVTINGLAIVLCLGAVFGDLFESLMKRAAGVKDSGTSIPGHGGMLDKSDALFFNCFLFYVYVTMVVT